MIEKKRVLVVDDHPVVRRGLAMLINMESDLEVCGEAEDVISGLQAVETTNPDIALVDISLKDSDGIQLIRQIRSQHGQTAILALSMHDESVYAERALRAGARGYVTKQAAEAKIIEAIRHVLEGKVYLSQSAMERLARRFVGEKGFTLPSPADMLSDREFEVFRLLGQGRTVGQIAEMLHRSVKTIETHQARIRTKLCVGSARDLAAYAVAWTKANPTS
jgi:DNA-binding NarL/FixJ family response regulator